MIDLLADTKEEFTPRPNVTLSSKELKAIAWYIKNNNLRLQLSIPPHINFTRKIDNTDFTENISDIYTQWSAWNEEDKKQRALDRKKEREFQEKEKRDFGFGV